MTYPNDSIYGGAVPLTKRELFSALAMVGLITGAFRNGAFNLDYELLGSQSLLAADALIAELNK